MSAESPVVAATQPAPNRVWLLVCFALVYVVWGSTYLAIKYALLGFPPMVMVALRFPVAGLLVLAMARLNGPLAPLQRKHIYPALLMGLLMLVLGNGLVVWAEQTVPSAWAALIITFEPLWVVALQWKRYRHDRRIIWSQVLGIAGMLVLVGPGLLGTGEVPLWGMVLCLVACMSWGYGTVISQRLSKPANMLQSSAYQMFAGGCWAALIAWPAGHWAQFDVAAVPAAAWWGMLFLIVAGSAVAYSAFMYLLQHVPPAQVVTHTYVNPVVAVLLGVWLLNEPVNLRIALAAMLLILAVYLMTKVQPRPA